MNPDYRYLSEHRRHRWDMPGSPIIESFKNGRPLILDIPEVEDSYIHRKWEPSRVGHYVNRAYRYRSTRRYSTESPPPAQQMGQLPTRKVSHLERYNRWVDSQ